MSIVTKSGVEITDEMMDAIADAFDRGELPGKMTRVVMGRPRISNEPLRSIGCRAPESLVLAFEKKAKKGLFVSTCGSDFQRGADRRGPLG